MAVCAVQGHTHRGMSSPGIRHRVVTPPAAPLLDSDEQAAVIAAFRREADGSNRCFRVAFCIVSAVLFGVLCYAAAVESPFALLASSSDVASTFHGAVGGTTPARVRKAVDGTQALLVAVTTARAATFNPLLAFRAGAADWPVWRAYLTCLVSGAVSLASLAYAWSLASAAHAQFPEALRRDGPNGTTALAAFSAWEAAYHAWPIVYHAVAAYAHAQMVAVEGNMATLIASQYRHKTV